MACPRGLNQSPRSRWATLPRSMYYPTLLENRSSARVPENRSAVLCFRAIGKSSGRLFLNNRETFRGGLPPASLFSGCCALPSSPPLNEFQALSFSILHRFDDET